MSLAIFPLSIILILKKGQRARRRKEPLSRSPVQKRLQQMESLRLKMRLKLQQDKSLKKKKRRWFLKIMVTPMRMKEIRTMRRIHLQS
jgi:hypothetical protein